MVKNCFSCRHYPNDEHCHGCGWDGSKNTKWESAKMKSADVLEKIKSEIEEDYSHTFNDGCINKNYVLSVIDKYMTESEEV